MLLFLKSLFRVLYSPLLLHARATKLTFYFLLYSPPSINGFMLSDHGFHALIQSYYLILMAMCFIIIIIIIIIVIIIRNKNNNDDNNRYNHLNYNNLFLCCFLKMFTEKNSAEIICASLLRCANDLTCNL